MKYFTIVLVSFIYWQWMPLVLWLSSFRAKRQPIIKVKNKRLIDLIFKSTGLRLGAIRVSASKLFFGMMIGIPNHPYMLLSRSVYEGFNQDELEYVVLHEVGHYLLGHTIKLALVYIILLIFGGWVISSVNNVLIWLIISFAVGVIMIQISRRFEYQADNFTLQRLSNPEGMITATYKFKKNSVFTRRILNDKDSLLGRLIFISIPYETRIEMARRKLQHP